MAPLRRSTSISTFFEEAAQADGFRYVAGLDEVGRGSLAGPVVAAAVILNSKKPLPEGLDDSKKLTRDNRERIADEICGTAIAYAVGHVDPDIIDQINILEATKLAMLEALAQLDSLADFLLIDALQLKACPLPQRAIIRGDSLSPSIAAASVIAKTYRDAVMRGFDDVYPQYKFRNHVGYATSEHLAALRLHGHCPLHRKSFHGVLPEPLFAEIQVQ